MNCVSGGQLRVIAVDERFQRRRHAFGHPKHGAGADSLALFLRRGQVGAGHEEIRLQPLERRRQLWIIAAGGAHAEDGVQLVHLPVRGHARVVLWHPLAAE
jgi:hypothetical protein